MRTFLHVLGHIGLGALSVGSAISSLLPAPYNLIVAGAGIVGNGLLGYFGVRTAPKPISPLLTKGW